MLYRLRATILLHACVLCAVATLAVRLLGAQTPSDSARVTAPSRQAKRFCWQGRPQDRCHSFALMELATHSHLVGSRLNPEVTRPGLGYSRWDDALASHLVVDLGAMVNVGARTALGGTVTYGSADAGGKPVNIVGATVRYRRWLTPAVSVDAGTGILRMPVGGDVQTVRRNVLRPALVADVRLGFRDLVSATGRFMVATDGQGRTHNAIFIGAATGSKVSAAIAGAFVAFIAYAELFGPRGDKVTVQ